MTDQDRAKSIWEGWLSKLKTVTTSREAHNIHNASVKISPWAGVQPGALDHIKYLLAIGKCHVAFDRLEEKNGIKSTEGSVT